MKSTKLLNAVAGISLAVCAGSHAESDALKEKAGPYELKNRSSFGIERKARAPFWPIGWVRPKDGEAVQRVDAKSGGASQIKLQPAHFNVTSILLGHPALVTINGRSFEEGEVLPVVSGSQRLRVVVRAIRDGGVWLEHESQQIYVPMRRPDLGVKQAEHKAAPTEFTIKIPQ